MGECPTCGKKKLFLKTKNCLVCGKEVCDKCMLHLMHVSWGVHDNTKGEEILGACSVQCRETFARRVEEEIAPSRFDLDEEEIPVRKFIDLAVRAGHSYQISNRLLRALEDYKYEEEQMSDKFMFYGSIDSNLWTQIERAGQIIRAKTLEKVRRFEDAAKVYERIGMYEEAGKVRAKDRQVTVRRTEVSVDLNSLLKQIRQGGVVVVYRCPHCNAPIKIGKGTNMEALRVCEHCGSEIEPIDVADILRTALS